MFMARLHTVAEPARAEVAPNASVVADAASNQLQRIEQKRRASWLGR
jgi:hypothetical protein